MELRHLHYFIAVAETLHFAAAAERLGIAPPTLSIQIKQLEQELGTELFTRTKRKVYLTQAGELFALEARATLAQAERSLLVGRRAGRGELGQVTVGYVSSALWSGLLSQLVAAYKQQWPEVNIITRELAMGDLPRLVQEGEIDIAVVRGPVMVPEGVSSLLLQRDAFGLVLSAQHVLAGEQEAIAAKLLCNEYFILPEQPSGSIEVAQRGGFTLHGANSENAGSLLDVLAKVTFNQGIAVVPQVLSQVVNFPGVVFKQMTGPVIPSEMLLLARQWERTPAIRHFINLAQQFKAH